jgi:hypothetical protein
MEGCILSIEALGDAFYVFFYQDDFETLDIDFLAR